MSCPATNSRRTLVVLCLASAGWAFSFGLGAPLASLWLRDAGCSAKVIGLNTSVYYLGIAAASAFVPWLMHRDRRRRTLLPPEANAPAAGGERSCRGCVVAGMAVDALVTALFPWAGGPAGWFLLRLSGGIATAMSLIPMETLVNHNAPPHRRARDFGFYAFSVALGVGLGSLAGLPLYPICPRLAFALGGLVTLLAAVLYGGRVPATSLPTEEASAGGCLSLGRKGLGYGTAWAQGFLEGGMVTFLSLYLLTLGYTEAAVGRLLGVLFLGVILFQVPVAWLADRCGRVRVLLACHAVLLAGLGCVPFCGGAAGLAAWLFALGACCSALYPLGLALLGERVPPGSLARANACYLASNCAGSLTGPVLIGLVIDLFGQRAQFAAAAAAVLLVLGLAAWRGQPYRMVG